MIFSELYSAYYNAVAAILSGILAGERSERELSGLVSQKAFGESVLTVMPSLKGGRWQLLHPDMTTPLLHKPTMPMTTLQKRWLKAILLDPRIRLFGIEIAGLEEVEPLFTPEDYCVYDQYGDGDPYEDEGYIERFRVILRVMHEGGAIRLSMENRFGRPMTVICRPIRLEYSERDDKFRLVTEGCRTVATVNLARIRFCAPYEGDIPADAAPQERRSGTLTLKVTDERNALERVMLHFAHFEKQVERLGENTYLLTVTYALDDENEMVIRVLSFGPLLEVAGPVSFRNAVKERLKKQKNCGLL